MTWKKMLVSPTTTIKEVIGIIDATGTQIAIVVDSANKVMGTITDGDIRRGILRGVELTQPAEKIMRSDCVKLGPGQSKQELLKVHHGKYLRAVPVVNEAGELQRVEMFNEVLAATESDHHVILMAGGRGSRLHPLTENCPKPLLKIGDKPILETIIDRFVAFGFRNFHFAVNYKSAMIQDHFGDGSQWGIHINYLEEKEQLGTAGALSLLQTPMTKPFIVMNADLITKVNFSQLLEFHADHGAEATMCVREYDFEVPYGVVQIQNDAIRSIDEKPIHRFFVNAGIYVLNPSVLNLIPKNGVMHMTTLFEQLIAEKRRTRVFPVREYWLDVGQASDFERAALEFAEAFKQ